MLYTCNKQKKTQFKLSAAVCLCGGQTKPNISQFMN